MKHLLPEHIQFLERVCEDQDLIFNSHYSFYSGNVKYTCIAIESDCSQIVGFMVQLIAQIYENISECEGSEKELWQTLLDIWLDTCAHWRVDSRNGVDHYHHNTDIVV